MSYDSTILAESSLVGYWALDETTGTSAADQKGSNPLTYSGGYTLGTTALLDSVCPTFTTTGVASCGTAPWNGTSAAGLECWFASSDLNQTYQCLVFNGTQASSGYGMLLNGPGATLGTISVLNGGLAWANTAVAVSTGVHHVVMSITGTNTVAVHLDGLPAWSGTVGPFFWAPSGNFQGAGGQSGGAFVGQLSKVALYNAPLSDSTVAAHYAAGLAAQGGGGAGGVVRHGTKGDRGRAWARKGFVRRRRPGHVPAGEEIFVVPAARVALPQKHRAHPGLLRGAAWRPLLGRPDPPPPPETTVIWRGPQGRNLLPGLGTPRCLGGKVIRGPHLRPDDPPPEETVIVLPTRLGRGRAFPPAPSCLSGRVRRTHRLLATDLTWGGPYLSAGGVPSPHAAPDVAGPDWHLRPGS